MEQADHVGVKTAATRLPRSKGIKHWDCELRRAFLSIPETELKALFKEIHHPCKKMDFTYERKGKYDVINLLPLPLVASRAQVKYLHRTCLLIKEALSKLIDLYLEYPEEIGRAS